MSDIPELNLNQQSYVHDEMLKAYYDFVCPDTGVVDLASGQQTIHETYNDLLGMGFPERHVKTLAAAALFDILDFHEELDRLMPDDFMSLADVNPGEYVYQSMKRAFNYYISPIDNRPYPQTEALDEELEEIRHIFEDAVIDPKLMRVASAKAHIDLVNEIDREFKGMPPSNPQTGDFYE